MDVEQIYVQLSAELRRVIRQFSLTGNWVQLEGAPSVRHYHVGQDVIIVFCEINALLILMRELSTEELLRCRQPMRARSVVNGLSPTPEPVIAKGIFWSLVNFPRCTDKYKERVDDLLSVVQFGLFEEWRLLPGEAVEEERLISA